MNISEYIKQEKLTQQEFAERVGVTQGMVNHWIHGRFHITPTKAVAIERATGGKVRRETLRPDIFGKEAA